MRCAVGGAGDFAARQAEGIGAHFAGSLHAAVAADGHQPAVLAAEEAPQEGEIRHLRDVVRAEAVLCEPHAPHENRASGTRQQLRELAHAFAGEAGRLLQRRPVLLRHVGAQLF